MKSIHNQFLKIPGHWARKSQSREANACIVCMAIFLKALLLSGLMLLAHPLWRAKQAQRFLGLASTWVPISNSFPSLATWCFHISSLPGTEPFVPNFSTSLHIVLLHSTADVRHFLQNCWCLFSWCIFCKGIEVNTFHRCSEATCAIQLIKFGNVPILGWSLAQGSPTGCVCVSFCVI
jgi:hypothetical protein